MIWRLSEVNGTLGKEGNGPKSSDMPQNLFVLYTWYIQI